MISVLLVAARLRHGAPGWPRSWRRLASCHPAWRGPSHSLTAATRQRPRRLEPDPGPGRPGLAGQPRPPRRCYPTWPEVASSRAQVGADPAETGPHRDHPPSLSTPAAAIDEGGGGKTAASSMSVAAMSVAAVSAAAMSAAGAARGRACPITPAPPGTAPASRGRPAGAAWRPRSAAWISCSRGRRPRPKWTGRASG
jgi:hypothetical protein